MRAINPSSSWVGRLLTLLDAMGVAEHRVMGFPDDWKQRKPWVETKASSLA